MAQADGHGAGIWLGLHWAHAAGWSDRIRELPPLID
jgi:hypothetical protein